MDAEADDEKLLNRAIRKAREIVSAYSADDRFQLLTMNSIRASNAL
jgi:hypothetical protein